MVSTRTSSGGIALRRSQAVLRQLAGNQFWGCTGYPDCKGTAPV